MVRLAKQSIKITPNIERFHDRMFLRGRIFIGGGPPVHFAENSHIGDENEYARPFLDAYSSPRANFKNRLSIVEFKVNNAYKVR